MLRFGDDWLQCQTTPASMSLCASPARSTAPATRRETKRLPIMAPQQCSRSVSDAVIADLKTRLGLTRFPDAAPGEPWAFGSSVDYVRDLVAYWKDSFDWRAPEAGA